MKRLIKYHNIYNSDQFKFSNCSTKYVVLPYVFPDDANEADLLKTLNTLNLVATGPVVVETGYIRTYTITHAVPIGTVDVSNTWGKAEPKTQYLGFITIKEPHFGISIQPDQPIPVESAHKLVDNCFGDISTTIEIDGENYVVMESWDAFHALPLAGYTFESFLDELEAKTTFSDEVSTCGSCGVGMWNDDGHTYNYRIVDECELLGVECGCFREYCLNNLSAYADKPRQAMELDVCEELETQGRLERIERFIGGMTDGRGGSYGGESTREGRPIDVLKELKKTNPKESYVFSHDESGQFQTYFSVWRIVKPEQIKIVQTTLKANKSKQGIHLIEPNKARIESAIEDAAKDGFKVIYVHKRRVKRTKVLKVVVL